MGHTKKHETMSLASAGKGEVMEVVSNRAPKDDSVGDAEQEKQKARRAKKMAMQKEEPSVNVETFFRERATATFVKHHDSKESKQKNGDEYGEEVKHAKKGTQSKHVKQAKAKKGQAAKVGIMQ